MPAASRPSEVRVLTSPVGLRRWRSAAASLTILAAAIAGCGYSIRAPYDRSVKTVFVPVFKTQSYRIGLNHNLTELVQKEIALRTPYRVVGRPEEADTILEGTVNFADKNIVVESPFNLPRQLNAMVSVSVNWTHNPPTEVEKRRPPHDRQRGRQLCSRSW
jgi:hypothetical protein